MQTTQSAEIGPEEQLRQRFFGRSLLLLAMVAVTSLGLGRVVGKLYTPQPLAPAAERVHASEQFLAIFGNSRVEAGVDPKRLAGSLSREGRRVDAQSFTGGGWDMLHYYMLALLAKDVLRPHQDGVLIEVSAYSLNDVSAGNRINVIRPEVALEIASLPGAPFETRLDVLMGAAVGLYRYRVPIQHNALEPRLSAGSEQLGDGLESLGLLRPPVAEPPFTLVTAPGRDFVIDRIVGDQVAFQVANRRVLTESAKSLRVGGARLQALERAVAALRARDIDVYLVQIPTSDWFDTLVADSAGGAGYGRAVRDVAARTGATLLTDWPQELRAASRFWDETHMTAAATGEFTDALAERIRNRRLAVAP